LGSKEEVIQNRLTNSSTQTRPQLIYPGLDFLGVASRSSLHKVARSREADFLVIFEINLKRLSQSNKTQTHTQIRIIDVLNHQEVASTHKLSSTGVEKTREDIGNEDPVDRAFHLVNHATQNELVLTPLPDFKTSHIAGRIDTLLKSKKANLYATLLELRVYHSMGLIADREFESVVQKLIESHQAAGSQFDGSAASIRKVFSLR